MKCNYCGMNVSDNSQFCPYCGKTLQNAAGTELTSCLPAQNAANAAVPTAPVQPAVTPNQFPGGVAPVQNQGQQVGVINQMPAQVPVQQPMAAGSVPVVDYNVGAVNPVPVQTKQKNHTALIIVIIIMFLCGGGFIGLTVFTNLNVEETKVKDKDLDSEKEVQDPAEVELSENRVQSDRVIMIYLIGSDLESQGGAATKDIKEMIDSNFNQEDIDLLVYAGGTKEWQNTAFEEKENAIYEVTNEDVVKRKIYEQKSMTDPNTLTEYLNYVYANYDSQKYSLIFWDHGGGPVFGYGSDENDESGKAMNIIDLDKAINNSAILKNGKLEFIGFDACLMSSVEIANMLKEEANYFIASSETEPGDGWDYDFLKEITKDTSSIQLGQHIVDYYYNYFENKSAIAAMYGYGYSPSVTLSLIDLTKIDNLNTQINNLFASLDSDITVDTYSKIAREVSRATFYGIGQDGTSVLDLVDLYDFTSELENYQALAAPIQQAIKEAVIYHKTNIYDCNGISMYFPAATKKAYDKIESTYNYGKMAVSENYKSFLKRYTGITSGDRLVKSDISAIIPEVSGSDIQMTIPSDITENYESVDYAVFKKIKDDGSFLPVYVSKDVEVSGNTVSATVTNRRIAVSDSNGEDLKDAFATEYSRDDTSITYLIYAVLIRWDDENKSETTEAVAVTIYLKVDKETNKGAIIDIKPINEEDSNTSGKVTYNLNDWKILKIPTTSYHMYDENGKLSSEWKNSELTHEIDLTIADGFKFYATTFDKDEEYYYMFRFVDTQGIRYGTDLVKAK